MWAYVDESGCLGMKFNRGSSRHFCVCAVVFKDRLQMQACYKRITGLQEGLKVASEWKFNKTSNEQRLNFFTEMRRFDFRYFGIVIDKTKFASLPRPLLDRAVLTSFTATADELEEVRVTIDKTGSSGFRKQMHSRLKTELNEQHQREVIREVKSKESHKHALLQLADMVAGAVFRSYEQDRKEPHVYRELIKPKELAFVEIGA